MFLILTSIHSSNVSIMSEDCMYICIIHTYLLVPPTYSNSSLTHPLIHTTTSMPLTRTSMNRATKGGQTRQAGRRGQRASTRQAEVHLSCQQVLYGSSERKQEEVPNLRATERERGKVGTVHSLLCSNGRREHWHLILYYQPIIP